MPRISNPLDRSRVRKWYKAGDQVEWSLTPEQAEQGRVVEMTRDGQWAWVEYGPERYTTMIEKCRLRLLGR